VTRKYTTINEQLGVSNDYRLELFAEELCFGGVEDSAEKNDDNCTEGDY